jgi:hypothetical protein
MRIVEADQTKSDVPLLMATSDVTEPLLKQLFLFYIDHQHNLTLQPDVFMNM